MANLFVSPWNIILLLIFALIIGSFLNVVIYRLPKMLFRGWKEQCDTFLKEYPQTSEEKVNLCLPSSHCPHCKTRLKPWQNIPLLSYLWQRGLCQHCQQRISFRYPLIELISALIPLFLLYFYGWSWQFAAMVLLSWGLLVLTFIDIDTQLLPDEINLSLLWLGLLFNTQHLFTDIYSALYGAVFGYLLLWLVAKSFYFFTKREGMGHGDFKLLALFGAWGGWQILLPTILMASLVGALIGIILIIKGKMQRQQPMPFGPYLAIAGWISLLWGQQLIGWWSAISW